MGAAERAVGQVIQDPLQDESGLVRSISREGSRELSRLLAEDVKLLERTSELITKRNASRPASRRPARTYEYPAEGGYQAQVHVEVYPVTVSGSPSGGRVSDPVPGFGRAKVELHSLTLSLSP